MVVHIVPVFGSGAARLTAVGLSRVAVLFAPVCKRPVCKLRCETSRRSALLIARTTHDRQCAYDHRRGDKIIDSGDHGRAVFGAPGSFES